MNDHEYRKGAHTVYRLHYHFVFVPKYRKPVLRDAVGRRVRELVRQICQAHDIAIVKGHIRPDHVHLLLSVAPKMAPSRVMQVIKGKTSIKLLQGSCSAEGTWPGSVRIALLMGHEDGYGILDFT